MRVKPVQQKLNSSTPMKVEKLLKEGHLNLKLLMMDWLRHDTHSHVITNDAMSLLLIL